MKAQLIEECIVDHLNLLLPHHPVSEVYHYACLPGGKFFRPSLVWSILKDLNPALYSQSVVRKRSAHAFLASSVELHHSYTLIHDDLPSMDNDLIRRGKPSTHVKFGEWQATLIGDGLLNLSFQILSDIRHDQLGKIIKIFAHCTGPKGLIEGQVLDLGQEMNLSLNLLLKTHELKTARLIQAALVLTALVSNQSTQTLKDLWRFGKELGISFQLLDDLTELCDHGITTHEADVNPFLKNFNETSLALQRSLQKIEMFNQKLNFKNLNEILKIYFRSNLEHYMLNQAQLNKNLSQNLDQKLIQQLQNLC